VKYEGDLEMERGESKVFPTADAGGWIFGMI